MFVCSKGVIPNSFGDNFFHLKKSPSTKHCWWSLCERAKSGLASSRPAEIPFYTISAILQRVQLKTIAMGFSSILRYIFTLLIEEFPVKTPNPTTSLPFHTL